VSFAPIAAKVAQKPLRQALGKQYNPLSAFSRVPYSQDFAAKNDRLDTRIGWAHTGGYETQRKPQDFSFELALVVAFHCQWQLAFGKKRNSVLVFHPNPPLCSHCAPTVAAFVFA
jgi:hypothetical protein